MSLKEKGLTGGSLQAQSNDQLSGSISSEITASATTTQAISLDESAARINEMLGVTDDDDASAAERRAIRRAIRNAQETATCCANCQRGLGPDEPVWRTSISMGRSFFGGWRTTVAPVCGECRWDSRNYGSPSPCEGCGRPVYNERNSRVRFLTFCCERCRRRAQAAWACEQRRRARSTRRCEMCGETFELTRTDAKFCSDACRQRAYRQRRVTDNASPPRRCGRNQ